MTETHRSLRNSAQPQFLSIFHVAATLGIQRRARPALTLQKLTTGEGDPHTTVTEYKSCWVHECECSGQEGPGELDGEAGWMGFEA